MDRYIARDNEEAAWQVILGIYDRVQVLRQFPESGHRYEKYPDKHIRILLYGHYRVAYLIRDQNTIHILGVLHRRVKYRRTSEKNPLKFGANLSPITAENHARRTRMRQEHAKRINKIHY